MSLRSVVAPLDEAAVAQVLDQSPDTLFALESFFDLSSERLAVVFDALDSSGDGMLSRDELLAGLSTVGVFYRSIDDPDFPAAGDDSTIDKQTFEAILRRAKLEVRKSSVQARDYAAVRVGTTRPQEAQKELRCTMPQAGRAIHQQVTRAELANGDRDGVFRQDRALRRTCGVHTRAHTLESLHRLSSSTRTRRCRSPCHRWRGR